jgi:hypothetical protein
MGKGGCLSLMKIKFPLSLLLLQALKDVVDPRLRREIEAALTKEKG